MRYFPRNMRYVRMVLQSDNEGMEMDLLFRGTCRLRRWELSQLLLLGEFVGRGIFEWRSRRGWFWPRGFHFLLLCIGFLLERVDLVWLGVDILILWGGWGDLRWYCIKLRWRYILDVLLMRYQRSLGVWSSMFAKLCIPRLLINHFAGRILLISQQQNFLSRAQLSTSTSLKGRSTSTISLFPIEKHRFPNINTISNQRRNQTYISSILKESTNNPN